MSGVLIKFIFKLYIGIIMRKQLNKIKNPHNISHWEVLA